MALFGHIHCNILSFRLFNISEPESDLNVLFNKRKEIQNNLCRCLVVGHCQGNKRGHFLKIRLIQTVMANRDNLFKREYTNRKVNLRVLLDMDGVLCDFEGDFLEAFKKHYPEEPCIELKDRSGFWLRDQYEKLKPGLNVKCSTIYNAKGFFQNLTEIPGAVEAAKEMFQMEGVDVFICTSPVNYYKYCLQEKFHWIEKHLGKQWLERILLMKDKSMANGHLLIDDRPNVSGANPYPSWDQVLFTSCHNKKLETSQRRLHNWVDGTWRELIAEYQKRLA
ncbi:5'(3')-deoxyribonucleotidase, mitochondrial-like isoform X2 [Dreissena polymorpha]|uniref:5'(3')-deoxyribonucleotidase, mitochondrial-like isoform X2 n=1 Tax=Dreissena polymorpha TaxID=45954 RepID=UPI0022642915|nr:5'(3')-deoxyribonucleotidase, mitochondrial-like isoform X2 [Dreissena polymorpha]